MAPSEHDFMAIALRLGRRNCGATGPNPSVGCIIVAGPEDHPRIVGRGVTAPGGTPHAETLALAQAGPAALGATAYTSLEPCAHQGRTPPCARALVEAGIARVCYPADDPNPLVAGKGRVIMEKAGIAVSTGAHTEEAAYDLAGFIRRMRDGRPHILLKLAVTADGKIAAEPGKKSLITGELAHRRSHLLRAQTDAIVVGIDTVLADNPRLTCRLEGLEHLSPVRIVVDTRARLPLDSSLVTTASEVPVWVVTGTDAPAEQTDVLAANGVEVIRCAFEDGKIDLADAVRHLGDKKISRLLVEGGAKLAAGFMARDLIDEICLFRSPGHLGPDGLDAFAGQALETLENNSRFEPSGTIALEPDTMTRYIRTLTGRAG